MTFHIEWDDQLFDRSGALELFDLIGSADKRLQAAPGLYQDTPACGQKCRSSSMSRSTVGWSPARRAFVSLHTSALHACM